MRKEGILISDSSGKVNALNRQYSPVFTPIKEEVIPSSPPGIFKIPHIFVEPEGVKKLLSSLNHNKAAGLDRISSRVLKELADELYRPLTAPFQNSLISGLVPDQWKSALVTPIFKKGDKHPAKPCTLQTSVTDLYLLQSAGAYSSKNTPVSLRIQQNSYWESAWIQAQSLMETQLLMFVDELLRSMSNRCRHYGFFQGIRHGSSCNINCITLRGVKTHSPPFLPTLQCCFQVNGTGAAESAGGDISL